MHQDNHGNIGLVDIAARKEDHNRERTTVTLSPDTKALLRKIGRGSISDGIYLSAAIVMELVSQKVVEVDFDKKGNIFKIGGKTLAKHPRSGADQAKKFHRARVEKLIPEPRPERNPYAGRVLSKEQLMDTGHFTHQMMRAILPGQRVTDRFGYWWYRADNPDRPLPLQRGLRNSRNQLMATYIGLEEEWDNWEKYSHDMGRFP